MPWCSFHHDQYRWFCMALLTDIEQCASRDPPDTTTLCIIKGSLSPGVILIGHCKLFKKATLYWNQAWECPPGCMIHRPSAKQPSQRTVPIGWLSYPSCIWVRHFPVGCHDMVDIGPSSSHPALNDPKPDSQSFQYLGKEVPPLTTHGRNYWAWWIWTSCFLGRD